MKHKKDIWYPLSAVQRSLWFQYRMRPEIRGFNNISFCVRILDGVDAIHLYRALNVLAVRHSILRTRFQETDGTPWQCVDPNATIEVAIFDVEHLSDEQLKQYLTKDTIKPFDLAETPLVRAGIYRRTGGQCILLLVFDQLICDGRSLRRLIDELGKLLESKPSVMAIEASGSPEMDYFTYVQEQQEWLKSKAAERQLRYWREVLAGDGSALDLPTDRPRTQAPVVGNDHVPMLLSAQLTNSLRQLAKKNGVTLHVMLLSAYFILLYRLTGQDSIAVGSPMPARGHGRWSDVAGTFTNVVVLHTIFEPSLTIQGLLQQIRSVVFRALRNQDYPFNELVEKLNPSRVQGQTPYFHNLFVFHDARDANDALSFIAGGVGCGQSVTVCWGGLETTCWREPLDNNIGVDLALKVSELDEGIAVCLHYASTLFERETIERWVGYWDRLLEAMVVDENQGVARIDLLDKAERRLVVEEWNATQTDYPADTCIHELFEAQAQCAPEAIAVVCEERKLSYAQLNVRANRLAYYLRKHGVKPDDRVAICVERSVEMVVGLLAVLKAGGSYVPLDPSYPQDRLSYMLTDSTPVAVLSDAVGKQALAGQARNVPVIDIGDEAPWANELESNPSRAAVDLTSRHLAYVIYTSGSTGRPKGAAMPHQALLNLLTWQKEGACRTLQFSAISFDVSFQEIFGTLTSGGELHLVHNDVRLNPEDLIGHVIAHGIERLYLPPIVLHMVSEAAEQLSAEVFNKLAASLKTIIIAGEQLRISEKIRTLFDKLPGCRLHNHYKPTETHVAIAFVLPEDSSVWEALPPISRPISNTQIYILDEYGAPVPVGVAGELYIGGAGVGRGYLNRPDLTAERFAADPFTRQCGARMYRTGDLARWRADGNIEFLGRNDFQVKIRGFRIEMGEIQARLAEQAGVREAVVVAREDGSGDKRLVAYYTGEVIGAEELRGQLAASLPQSMVPAAYVHLDALPLTPNGKLDRAALPAPEEDAYASRGYEPPWGDVEEQLAAIWSDLLKIERVGRHDNFFELGGHSLLAVQLVSRLRQALKVEMSLPQIFAYPTLQALAKECLSSNSHWLGVVSLRTAGDDLPLFLVHEVFGEVMSWGTQLTRHLDTNIPVYGLAAEPPADLTRQTMEGMATRLVQAIRCVQPNGPYRIAGWSFGGMLAYEIATQLIGNDEEVQFLGLLDTCYRDRAAAENLGQDSALLKRLILRQNPSPATVKALDAVDPADLDALWRKCQELSVVPERLTFLSMTDIRLYFSRMRLHVQAAKAYEAYPINIPVNLFIAQDNHTAEPPLGWNEVLPAERMSLTFVPGDHLSMIQEPNVAALGAQLSRCICERAQAISPERIALDSVLIPIRTAPRTQSSIVCLPGAGGSAASFTGLADALGEGWRIYSIQPRGLNGADVPHSTVSAAVRAYMKSLETLPAGPVHLVGHSFGGWVAFEMALRLQASGRSPASLTLIDSEAPHSECDHSREYTHVDVLMELVAIWEMTAECSLNIDRDALEALKPADRLALLHERAVRVQLMSPRTTPGVLVGTIRTVAAALRTCYRPETTYVAPVNLILLADPRLRSEAQERQFIQAATGWRRWAPKSEVWRGPGNHMTALKLPDVRILANWLRPKLNFTTAVRHKASLHQ
ncbi:MAG: amino acid adenylation domain-containing protein [Rhodanobacter sp.]|jgi:amino acid adenylation domain-containing protein|nr:amino acid adenylation domain-containing protein [Rhodanobacter sp.]